MTSSTDTNSPDLTGRICLVTGATSGIGKITARELARMSAVVVLVARDRGRGEATRDEIRDATGNDQVDLLLADLSSQQSIRDLAAVFKQRYQGLHVLVNNAGGVNGARTLTVDGCETTFAVNHLGYFLLTELLLDGLKASAPSRIVNVASDAARGGHVDFDDLQGEGRYSAWRAYSQSKLANILFTFELARRLQGTGVTVNAVHPGSVATNFGRSGGRLFSLGIRLVAPFMRSPEKGAETVVYLASSPLEGVTGKYFVDCTERQAPKEAYDELVARRLWDVSAQLTHVS
jgi:NAD(P)-dependent dehydrogenase (short-subunit alcohol dehydrogenase family)